MLLFVVDLVVRSWFWFYVLIFLSFVYFVALLRFFLYIHEQSIWDLCYVMLLIYVYTTIFSLTYPYTTDFTMQIFIFLVLSAIFLTVADSRKGKGEHCQYR